ncbi:type IV pilin protein [Acinetobacter modestus]|nr:type IV pilin protein [Acinetobacter modestus]
MVMRDRGFTLIELMIVITIIAIVAAFAFPSYQEYVRKAKRTDAESDMMAISNRLQKYKIANFSFLKANAVPITLSDIGQASQSPQSGTPLYNLSLSNVTATTWLLTATPITTSTQYGNGHIVLNHRGQRCWVKGTDKNSGLPCVPSDSTNWDGR